MATSNAKTGVGVLGAGAAACAVCCAGPVLGLLAATGVATLLGVVAFGVLGLLVAVLGVVPLWRRRRPNQCASADQPTPVQWVSRSAGEE